jgi:hypothetical protein
MANPFYQNPDRIARVWKRDFANKLDQAVSALANAPTAERSPILDSIAAASWRRDFDRRIPNRRLIVVSDLLEYDPGDFSLYRKGNPWLRFRHSAVSGQAQAELSGVSVQIELLRRPAWLALQAGTVRAFWQQWLGQRGATSVEFGASAPSGTANRSQLAMGH